MLGISKEDATLIALEFNQHAFVFGEYNARASCVSCLKSRMIIFMRRHMPPHPDLHHGNSFDTWGTCLGARRFEFHIYLVEDAFFKQPYHGGYLCWLKE